MLTIDGVCVPETRLCRDLTELGRVAASEMLFNHSCRVYYFAALAGVRRGLNFDRELLYAAAIFHDLGLLPRFSSLSDRFEVDGANAARRFLEARKVNHIDIDLVWAAIALHTSRGIPAHMHPLVALLTEGVLMDVVGIGYDDFTPAQRQAVVEAFPRTAAFEDELLQAFYEGMKYKPEATFGNVNAHVLADKDPTFQPGNYCAVIRGSRWRKEAADRAA